MKIILFFLVSIFSVQTFAVEMRVANCWPGFNNQEQAKNLQNCKSQVKEYQSCSANMFEHQHAAYDVCLMEAVTPPTNIVACAKGSNQAQQNQNLNDCKSRETFGSFCVTSIWVHKQAAYDVCLMN
jgi:hypothetical protein